MFPNANVVENVRWVDGGISSRLGISAGIDMSLHLVRRLVDNDLAEKTARQLEFNWTQNRIIRKLGGVDVVVYLAFRSSGFNRCRHRRNGIYTRVWGWKGKF